MTPSEPITETVRTPDLRRAARGVGDGILGGLVATGAMSIVMLAAQKAGLTGRLPPSKITDAMLGFIGVRPFVPSPAKKALAVVNHLAFGAACGAVFGAGHALLGRRAPSRRAVPAGLAFGTAVWALSYAGWVPALGIMPSPKHDRAGRPTSMVLAHWVYGAVLAKVVDARRT